ncbi:hypothetical protein ACFU44_00440 [Nocardia rhizosphaerihabitans]|uniref:hypothetical protein n=1 Tax=Nocardia rhizosphaerihabitans TaxID=1691570 RepID=UPI00366A8B1E
MASPQTYRKKPVAIEAMHFRADLTAPEAMDIYHWVERNTLGSFEPLDVIEGRKPYPESGVSIDPRDGRMIISTLEGLHWVDLDDRVLRGVQGEFYPCKPEIFEATYEAVGATQDTPTFITVGDVAKAAAALTRTLDRQNLMHRMSGF